MTADPAKSIRRAMRVARKERAPGGRLELADGSSAISRAIKQFSKHRASQWDPQGVAKSWATWDPQGVGQAANRQLMLADAPQPPKRPKSTMDDLGGDAKQGEDLYDVVNNGARALGFGPAKKDTAGSTGVGHVDLTGSGSGSAAGSSAPPSFSGDARKVAEDYLGRPMSDTEYDWLRRATVAESGGDPREDAMITASILNRARGIPGDGVIVALKAPNQFQAVTGTAYNNHAPSALFVKPDPGRLGQVETNMGAYLPNISNDQKNFTAASDAAYGPGTTIKYRDDMARNGGSKIGGSYFNTAFPGQPSPVQAAGPGVPTSPAAAVARGPAPSDDRSTWQKDKFGTPITPPGWMPPELRGKPGNETAAQPGASVNGAPSPAPLHQSGPLQPSAVSGAPKGHLRIADPEGLNTYPGPNETSAPQQTGSQASPVPPIAAPQPSAPLPRPPAAYGYGSAPQQDQAPEIAAPPPAALPTPADKGIPDAPFHTASLGPEGDSAPPPAAQQQDTTPPPELPHHDIYGDLAMPDVVLPARRGGKISNALKIARKHRAGGGGTSTASSMTGTGLDGVTPFYGNAAAAIAAKNAMGDAGAQYNQILSSHGGQNAAQQAYDTGMNQSMAFDYASAPTAAPAAAPKAAAPTTAATPAPDNTVGNSFQVTGTQGAPVTDGKYNNTLNEVLGTNNPTMQDIFGFNYPGVPAPQPNPYVGPVSTMSGSYDPGSGGSSTSGYVGSVGATPTGQAPTLLSPAPVNYPNSDLTYLPPLVGGGNTNNAPSGSMGKVPVAMPNGSYLGVKRGGAVGRALDLARRKRADGGQMNAEGGQMDPLVENYLGRADPLADNYLRSSGDIRAGMGEPTPDPGWPEWQAQPSGQDTARVLTAGDTMAKDPGSFSDSGAIPVIYAHSKRDLHVKRGGAVKKALKIANRR